MRQIYRRLHHVKFAHVVLVLILLVLIQDLHLRFNDGVFSEKARGPGYDCITPREPPGKSETVQKMAKSYDFQSSPMSRDFRVSEVDCARIIEGDENEIAKAKEFTAKNISTPRPELAIYMDIKSGCQRYIRTKGFIMSYLTEEERDFPIAMNIMLYKEFHQVENLMRAIYRPQNYYCLHVDKTSDAEVHNAARAFASCFRNVIVPRAVIDVVYGQLNLMTPEIICMYELLRYKSWKYFINWTGQEYPVKTNRQMVKIFKAFNGANDLVTSPKKSQGQAFRNRWNKHGTPPHGIQLVKGSSHIVVSRAFVEFLTSDKRIRGLVSFLFGTIFPEESFWTSVNNDPNLRAPGGFSGSMDEAIDKPWNGRVKWWMGNPEVNCTGFYKHAICIFGVGDIGRVVAETAIIANKFYWDSQPMALRCMQEWMFNRTRDEYLDKYRFDASHYAKLPNAVKAYR